MNFDVFDFIDYPKLVRTYTFEPIDIDLIFSSRPTTDKKEETKKPVDSFETKQSTNRRVKIRDVIFSDPATVVFWNDNTKTVVKTRGGEKYDKEKGLAMAIIKKITGNTRDYYEIFKEWCSDEE
mgnify:CR=1 FL=1